MTNRIRLKASLSAVAAATSLITSQAAQATPVTIDNGVAQLLLDMTNGAGAATYIRPGGYPTQLISQMSWFYRVDGDSQEHRFGTPDSVTVSAGSATFQWSEADFVATLVIDLVGAHYQTVVQSMTIENTGADPLGISIFSFVNYNANGPGATDGPLYVGSGYNDKIILQLQMMSESGATIRAYDTELGAVDDAGFLLGLLEDESPTDFGNIYVQKSTGDTALAIQWSQEIGSGDSFSGVMSVRITPTPSAALLAGAAFTCLAARRRRPI